jgi:parallel beta-helix repeat protein
MLKGLISAVCAVATVLVLSPAMASATHVQCGDVIAQDTTLDSDLIDCPGDGVVIGAGGITLDLAGHTIDGTRGPTQGVQIHGADNVTVANGQIRDFQDAVSIHLADTNLLTGLELIDSGFGVNLEEASLNRIEGNIVRSTGAGVILFREGSFNVVRDNAITGTGTGVLIAGVFTESPADNEISANDISLNSTAIFNGAAERTRILGNRVADNLEEGITDRSGSFQTRIEDNDVSTSGTVGISISNSFSAGVVHNRSSRNGTDGIVVGVSAQDVTVAQNFALRNGDDGIDTDTSRTTIAANKANANGDLGIEAVPGVTDGGGNKAHGNGNRLQCMNVRCR